MTEVLQFDAYRFATAMVWLGTLLVLVNLVAVVSERTIFALGKFRRRLLEHRYQPNRRARHPRRPGGAAPPGSQPAPASLLYRTLAGAAPLQQARPRARRHGARDPRGHVAFRRHRSLAAKPAVVKRIAAVRAFGILQMTTRTSAIVAALDDENDDVRAAALDALADLGDPQSLQALMVRLHDESLPRGRRFAAVAAFGDAGETFLLEMSSVDTSNRADYARAAVLRNIEVNTRAGSVDTGPGFDCARRRLRSPRQHRLKKWDARELPRCRPQHRAPTGELARQTLWEVSAGW